MQFQKQKTYAKNEDELVISVQRVKNWRNAWRGMGRSTRTTAELSELRERLLNWQGTGECQ